MTTKDDLVTYFLVTMAPSWRNLIEKTPDLNAEFDNVCTNLATLYKMQQPITPSRNNIMRVLKMPPERVRVVVVGQDPYPKTGCATGVAFGNLIHIVAKGCYSPSLKNILTATKCEDPTLLSWFGQGVFLTNTVWTATRDGQPGESIHYFWKPFTTLIMREIARIRGDKLVAMLWGSLAHAFSPLFAQASILKFHHPSPQVDNHLDLPIHWKDQPNFAECNAIFARRGEPLIKWNTKQFEFSWPLFLCFTDGGCTGNGRADAKGGIGVVILRRVSPGGGLPLEQTEYVVHKRIARPLIPPNPNDSVTNQTAELLAAIFALDENLDVDPRQAFGGIGIVTDSAYTIHVANGGATQANLGLVQLLCERVVRFSPMMAHVRGHQIKVYLTEAELADQLCPKNYDRFMAVWNHETDRLANVGLTNKYVGV